MLCKFPDKYCADRYESHPDGRSVKKCRLAEWKRKKGTCRYDRTIKSHIHVKKRAAKGQQRLT